MKQMDREKVIKEWESILSRDPMDIPWDLIDETLTLLKEQEAVVRCKDCKHCYFASNRIPCEQTLACGKHGIDIAPDWFCADGERADT